MLQLANLLLAAFGLILTIYGLSANVLFVGLGVGLVAIAYILDKKRAQGTAEKQRVEIAARIVELTEAPWAANQTLKIGGGGSLAAMVLFAGLASAWAIYAGATGPAVRWPLLLSGLLFAGFSLLAAPRCLAGLGSPLCEIDQVGFVTPIHRRIPWQKVVGICLQQSTHRGITISSLLFKVADYQQIVIDVHWSEKILGAFGLGAARRGVIGVPLRSAGEKPETVYAVARAFWKKATGLDYDWNPMCSDEYNEAVRRMAVITAQGGSWKDKNPGEMLRVAEQMDRDFSVMRDERKKMVTRGNWLAGMTVLLLMVAVAMALLKLF